MDAQKKAPAATEASTHKNELNISLCSGFGQYHSAKNASNPQPYEQVTLSKIVDMLVTPQSVDKSAAQWVIFSTLASRDVIAQRERGDFYALWADIDDTKGQKLTELFNRACSAVDADMLCYTSRSATEDNQKFRLIVPLAHGVNGKDFEILQKVLNDKLETVGIMPDHKTETANQICYLPNRGEFYDFMENPFSSKLSADMWGDELAAEYAALEVADNERKQRLEQSRQKLIQRQQTSEKSPIDAYKAAYRAVDMLPSYGGKIKDDRALSPLSESGVYQMKVLEDGSLLSHHGSDMEAGLGKLTESGKSRRIDAWDLFVYFEHNGDQTAALKDAGAMFKDANSVSITKANQIEYMSMQARQSSAASFDFKKYSLNGSSKAMKAQMLSNKFVLDGIAILGQATALYAKPNSGKTLLAFYLLCDGIERGEVNGEDVFYINADDNYPGLVTKLEIAEKYGFNMVAPGFNEFSVNDFADHINAMIKEDQCRGKVIILDTLKKFTNIMDKKVATDFGKIMRGFVTKGGTMILLAHTNKNRDAEGKVVFSGTSDVVDDVDCAYIIDVTEQNETSKTVLFENIKSRGDVEHTVAYQYASNITQGNGGYRALLDSVTKVSESAAEEAKQRRGIIEKLEKNAAIIEALQEVLETGEMLKTDLIETAHKLSGTSKERIAKTLDAHTGKDWNKGHRWTKRKGERHSYLYRALNHLST